MFGGIKFQSTQPSQAVTVREWAGKGAEDISIHTALAGCDDLITYISKGLYVISIHTALAGCDLWMRTIKSSTSYFNPHSPRRL